MNALVASVHVTWTHLLAGAWSLRHPQQFAAALRSLGETIHLGGRSIRTPPDGVPALETIVQPDGDMQTIVDRRLFDRYPGSEQRDVLAHQHLAALIANRSALERMLKTFRLGRLVAIAAVPVSWAAAFWRPLEQWKFDAFHSFLSLMLPPVFLTLARIGLPPLLRLLVRRSLLGSA